MKKRALLNQPISAVIAGMGHTDELVIADAGLPIPRKAKRIDLALTKDVPRFLDTLRIVLTDLEVEKAVIAEEMLAVSPQLHEAIMAIIGDVPVEMIEHETFKNRSQSAVAIIRTGEFTPYGNIILIAGVVF